MSQKMCKGITTLAMQLTDWSWAIQITDLETWKADWLLEYKMKELKISKSILLWLAGRKSIHLSGSCLWIHGIIYFAFLTMDLSKTTLHTSQRWHIAPMTATEWTEILIIGKHLPSHACDVTFTVKTKDRCLDLCLQYNQEQEPLILLCQVI